MRNLLEKTCQATLFFLMEFNIMKETDFSEGSVLFYDSIFEVENAVCLNNSADAVSYTNDGHIQVFVHEKGIEGLLH